MFKKGLIAMTVLISLNAVAASGDTQYKQFNKFAFKGINLDVIEKAEIPDIDGKRIYKGNAISSNFKASMPDNTILETDTNYTYLKITAKFADQKTCKQKFVDEHNIQVIRQKYSCRLIRDQSEGSLSKQYKGYNLNNSVAITGSNFAEMKNCPYYYEDNDSESSIRASFNVFNRYTYVKPNSKQSKNDEQGITRIGDIETSVVCGSDGSLTYLVKDVYRNKEVSYKKFASLKFPEIELPKDPAKVDIESDNKTKITMKLQYDSMEDCFDKAQQHFFMKFKDYDKTCSATDRLKGDCSDTVSYMNIKIDFNDNRYDRKLTGARGDWHFESKCSGGTFELKSNKI